jgi:hypothetical protein
VTESGNLYFTTGRVLATALTGYTVGTNTALAATDTILGAFGKVQGQLNAKENAITAGTTAQYFRGDKTFQTLNTAAVTESTNLYFTNARAIASVLTGYTSGAGTISAADTILSAIQKLNGNIGGLTTGVSSVFGRTGAVVAANGDYTTAQVTESGNLYFTSARVLATALTGYVVGTNAALAATDTILGAFGKVQAQINAKGSGTVTSVAALTLGTTGTDLSSTVANGTTTPVITLNVPTASAANRGALSADDWTIFNGKQNALNGTGFVKIAGTTITYDNTNYLPLTGGTLTGTLNGTTAVFSNTVTAIRGTFTDSNQGLIIGYYTGGSGYGALYASTLTPNNSNYSFIAKSDNTVVNAPTGGSVNVSIANTIALTIDSTRNAQLAGKFSLRADASASVTTQIPVFIANPSATTRELVTRTPAQFRSDIGAGTVTSVAALTLGTTGTDLSSTVANGTTTPVITLNVPTASAANRGALSAADWTTFNGKQDNIVAGTTAQYYRGDKTFQTLNTAAVPELTNLYYTEARVSANTDVAANTAARHNAVTLGTANGLSLSTQELSLGLASSSANGALSSTDWTTFNNKQNALTNPVTGTGTAGQVAFWDGTTTQTGDSGLTWNNTVKRLDLLGTDISTIKLRGNTSGSAFVISQINSSSNAILLGNSGAIIGSGTTNMLFSHTIFDFYVGGSTRWSILANGSFQSNGAQTIQTSTGNLTLATAAGNGNIVLSPNGTGNVGIGTNGPSQKLDVVGKFRVTDDIILAQTNGRIDYDNGVTGALRFYSTSTAAERMRITSTGNVGIGTTAPNLRLFVRDDINGEGGVRIRNANSGTDASAMFRMNNDNSTDSASQVLMFLNSSTRTVDGGVNTFTIRNNIGDIRLSSSAGGNVIFMTSSTTERMRITSTGNVGIGTASPAGILNVAGTNAAHGTTGIPSIPTLLLFRATSSASNYAGLVIQTEVASSNFGLYSNQNGALFYHGGSERMRIASGGSLTINNLSGSGNRIVVANSGGTLISAVIGSGLAFDGTTLTATGGSSGSITGSGTSGIIPVFTGTSSIGNSVITQSGTNVGISAASPVYKLDVGGDIGIDNYIRHNGDVDTLFGFSANDEIKFTTTGVDRLTIASTGAATFTSSVTATSFFESSDATIKTLVEDAYQAKGIDSVVAKLYIKNGKQELGYYAQDLEGVLPSAVSKGSNGLLNLSYREVHTAKIAYLEQQIKELRNELVKPS